MDLRIAGPEPILHGGEVSTATDDDIQTGGEVAIRRDARQDVAIELPVVIARGSSPAVGGPRDSALEHIPEATLKLDAHGVIEDANALAEALVGLDRAALVGREIETVIIGLHAAVKAETGRVLNGQTVFIPARAGACVIADGRPVPVTVLLCPYEDRSRLAIVTSLINADVKVLREDDVAQIVHDLKSPLATIALETEMLEVGEAEGIDRALLARVLHRIVLNVSFLDRMISNLLDLCAFDAGRMVLHRSRVELRTLVERVVERAVPSRDRPRIVLRMPTPAVLEIDEYRIERVIANLVQNALKYASPTSHVVISIGVHVPHVRVSVADHGPGIAPDQQAALFGKYRRLEGARLQEGSGLGLYVSKRIVEAHGGQIGVESSEGRGSCFYFELPRT